MTNNTPQNRPIDPKNAAPARAQTAGEQAAIRKGEQCTDPADKAQDLSRKPGQEGQNQPQRKGEDRAGSQSDADAKQRTGQAGDNDQSNLKVQEGTDAKAGYGISKDRQGENRTDTPEQRPNRDDKGAGAAQNPKHPENKSQH